MGSSFLLICKLAVSLFPSLAPPVEFNTVMVKFSMSSGILNKNEYKFKQRKYNLNLQCLHFCANSSIYLIGYREESEVFEVLPFLEGYISLEGTDVSGQGWLQDPGNWHLPKVTPVPHYRVHRWKQNRQRCIQVVIESSLKVINSF